MACGHYDGLVVASVGWPDAYHGRVIKSDMRRPCPHDAIAASIGSMPDMRISRFRLSVLRELRAVTVELVVPLLSHKSHEGRYNGLIVRAEAVHVRRPH